MRRPSSFHSGFSGRRERERAAMRRAVHRSTQASRRRGGGRPGRAGGRGPVEAGHPGLEQGHALLDPRPRPFAAAQRRITVELVEAELGVNLEDGPLVVGGDIALDLADPGQQVRTTALRPTPSSSSSTERDGGKTMADPAGGREQAAGDSIPTRSCTGAWSRSPTAFGCSRRWATPTSSSASSRRSRRTRSRRSSASPRCATWSPTPEHKREPATAGFYASG